MKRFDEMLNRILRHPALSPEDYIVIYEHRGGPHGLQGLRVSELAHCSRGALVLREGTQIPCHRVVQVRNWRTGELLAGEKLELDEETWKELVGSQQLTGNVEVAPRLPEVKAEESPGAAFGPQPQKIMVGVRVAYPEEGEYSWSEALRDFRALGAVEVAFTSPQLFLNNVEIRDVVSPVSKLSIQASSIHMAHAPLTEPEVFAGTLEKTVRIAKALNCPLIVVHSSRGGPLEADDFFAQRIDPLLERAQALLCWETFESKRRFLSGIEAIARFCEGRRCHAACYDTSHLHKPQEEVIADIKAYASIINVFHLSNRSGLEQHLPLRHLEGKLEFTEILKAIVDSGFSGSITLEYLKEHHDHLLEDAQWVKGMLDKSIRGSH